MKTLLSGVILFVLCISLVSASNIGYVVGNPNSLDEHETAIRNILTNEGYNVYMLDDVFVNSPQNYDLFIVGEEIWDISGIFDNLNHKTLFLSDTAAKKSGLSYSNAHTSYYKQAEVVKVDSVITADFDVGDVVEFYNINDKVNYLTGCLAKNAETLTEVFDNDHIVKFKVGSLLLDGSCVYRTIYLNQRNLFFGSPRAANWNDNGEELFLKSVAWLLNGEDFDGDGFYANTDCNDTNDQIWNYLGGYIDGDGDGFGAGSLLQICSGDELPEGYSEFNSDCNDVNSNINPDADEIPYNGIDDDCYQGDLLDVDGDGINWPTDCDDNDNLIWQNLSGYTDGDGDGFGAGSLLQICSGFTLEEDYSLINGDCDDADSEINPDADEILDGIDQNCLNDAPFFIGTIEDLNWNEDDELVDEIDLIDYFFDYEGDDLIYSVNTLSNENVNILIDGGIVSFSSEDDWFGSEITQFKAEDTDSYALSNSISLDVTPVNDAPVLEFIDDITISEGDLVSVNAAASDVDGDELEVSFSDPLNENGQWLTEEGDVGDYEVEVSVSDGKFEVNQEFLIHVVPRVLINEFESDSGGLGEWVEIYNPSDSNIDLTNWKLESQSYGVLWTFPAYIIDSGEYYLVDVTNIFNQGDVLTLYNSIGNVVDRTPNLIDTSFGENTWQRSPNGFDSDSIDDWKFKKATKGFDNDADVLAPVVELISPINNSELKTDSIFLNFSVDDNVANELECYLYSDIYGEFEEVDSMTVVNGSSNVFSVSGLDDSEYKWNVECFDGINSGAAESEFVFVVNDTPYLISDIEDMNWNEDENLEINLTDYFIDEDAELDYSYSSLENIKVTILDGVVTFTPDYNWFGSENIIFTACDEDKCLDSNSVLLTVVPVNDAPVLEFIDDITISEGDLVSVNAAASDVDGDELIFTFEAPLDWRGKWLTDYGDAGTYNINVSVSDGELSDSQIVFVNILDENEPPYLDPIPDAEIAEDSGVVVLGTLSATDNDGVVSQFRIVNEDTSKVDCRINGNELRVEPISDWFGNANCTVQAVDNDGATDEYTFRINVTNVNDAPIIISVDPTEDILTTEDGREDLSVTWQDIDNDASEISVQWFVNNILSGNGNTFVFTASGEGEYDVEVRVSDGEYEDTEDWNIEASAVPITNQYNGATTHFSGMSDSELADLDLVLEKEGVGKIEFLDGVDMRDVVELDKFTNILFGFVGINSDVFDVFKNKLAKITLYGLNFEKTPTIYYDSGFNINSNSNQVCSDTICTNINYDSSSGKLEFEVSGFSSFIIGETRTCSQQNGRVCSENMVCSGNIIEARDSDSCCSSSCVPKLSGIDRCESLNPDVKIKIKDPDKEDDFKVGDIVEGELEINNKLDEDLEFDLEIVLYNIDNNDEIETLEENLDIDEGDKESLEFKFELDSDLEEGDYIIFVRAIDEDEIFCNEEYTEINVEKEKYDLKLKEISISPANLACGDEIEMGYKLENIGRADLDDIYIKISNGNTTLAETEKFDIKDGKRINKAISFDLAYAQGEIRLVSEIFFEEESIKREDIINVECKQEERIVETATTSQLNQSKQQQIAKKLKTGDLIFILNACLVIWSVLIFIIIIALLGRRRRVLYKLRRKRMSQKKERHDLKKEVTKK